MYVFVLLIYLGVDRKLEDTMVFNTVENCNYYAAQITKRYSTHGLTSKDKVVAYCLPRRIQDVSP